MLGGFHVRVPGEVWRVQGETGDGHVDVAVSSHDGQCTGRGSPNDEGVPRLDSSLCRTVGPRWGLESSLCIIPAGRTTTPCLLREASEGVLLRPSFRCTSPRPLGSSSVSLSQGSGFNNHPQDGSQNCEASVTKHPGTPKSPPDTSGTGSPPRRPKFPKKPKAGSEPQPKAS